MSQPSPEQESCQDCGASNAILRAVGEAPVCGVDFSAGDHYYACVTPTYTEVPLCDDCAKQLRYVEQSRP